MRHFSSGYRLALVATCVLLAFSAVAGRLAYLHIWTHQSAVKLVSEARRQVQVLKARRGDIIDANGTPLATSRSIVKVGVDPVVIARAALKPPPAKKAVQAAATTAKKKERTFEEKWIELASLLNMSPAEMNARIQSRVGTWEQVLAAAAAEEAADDARPQTPAPAATTSVAQAGFMPSLGTAPAPAAADTPLEITATPRQPAAETAVVDVDGEPEEARADVEVPGKARKLSRYIKLADGIEDSTYSQIRELGLKGVVGSRDYRRFYPGESLAAHVVGYLDRGRSRMKSLYASEGEFWVEGAPVMGIEKLMDYYLRGQDGWRESERDGKHRELARFRSREVLPVDGMTVQLSLDTVIQHMLEAEIARIQQEFKPKSTTIIVSDPRTGFILGMANGPTFSLNEFNEPKDQDERGRIQRNRAIFDVLEPGSTFKIVAIGAALDLGVVQPGTTFDASHKEVNLMGRSWSLPDEAHPILEPINVTQAVAKSSNRASAQMGIMLGRERLYQAAQRFGFGQPTGFAITGERRGTLHKPQDWSGTDITRIPIGHTVDATPLQIHMAMASIANDGQLHRPQIISRLLNHDGSVACEYEPVIRHRVLSSATARTLTRMLMEVAKPGGTAKDVEIPGYEIAGKTGTARKIINGHYSKTNHVATFSGFFPATNPRVAMTIIIDDANLDGVAYASKVAVPPYRRLALQLIQYLGIAPVTAASHLAAAQ